jgi:hypothetical protein
MQGALDTLSSGSIALLENGYENAGSELTVMYLDLLTETNADLSADPVLMETIYKIDNAYPTEKTAASPKRVVSRNHRAKSIYKVCFVC